MSNDSDHSHSYQRLSGSPPFHRNKFVRASFKMLGSKWKALNNATNDKKDNQTATTKKSTTATELSHKKDFVSERFGKEFNQNVFLCANEKKIETETMPTTKQSLSKNKGPHFFSAFTKENFNNTKQINHTIFDLPRNVAPKAAALLQIPIDDEQITGNRLKIPANEFNVKIESKACELIANSKQFKLLNDVNGREETNNVRQGNETGDKDRNRENKNGNINVLYTKGLATVRRVPHRINNQPYCKRAISTLYFFFFDFLVVFFCPFAGFLAFFLAENRTFRFIC